MLVASISTEVKCYKWPDISTYHVYSPEGAESINTISWSKDGGWVVIVPSSGQAEVVSFNDSVKSLHTIQGILHPTCATFQNSTKRNIAIGTPTGQLLIYDIKTKSVKKRFPHAPSELFKVQYSLKDTHVIAGCNNGEIFIYNNVSGLLSGSFKVAKSCTLTNFMCHPEKRNLIGGCSEEGIVSVWDLNTSKQIGYIASHRAPVNDISFSKTQSEIMISLGMDRTICLYDYHNSKIIKEVKLGRTPTAVDFCPDGFEVIVGFQDGKIVSYDTRNLNESNSKFVGHKSKINQIVFERVSDDKIKEFSLPDEKGESIAMSEVENNRKSLSDSMAHMYCGDYLSGIPEVDNENSANNCFSKDKDSFMDAMGLNWQNSPIIKSDSILSITDGVKKLMDSKPNLFDSKQDVGKVDLHNSSKNKSKLHVENFTKTQHISTPNHLGNNDMPFYSPILAQSTTNINTPQNNRNGETGLGEEDIKRIVKETIREEMTELKKEIKFQIIDAMVVVRQHILDLQMSVVREFMGVEDHIKRLEEHLSSDNI